MAVTALLLWYFWHATHGCKPEDANEGLQLSVSYRKSWRLIFVCFVLSVVYLPLSTLAIHALVWSSDFWVTRDNENGTVTSGPLNEFREPTDVCYTTTIRRNEINLAPAVIVASAITFIFVCTIHQLGLRWSSCQLAYDLVSHTTPKDCPTGNTIS